MRAWIAKDKSEAVWLYLSKPNKEETVWMPLYEDCHRVEREFLPEGVNPQWSDDEPIEVELKIERL